jgi:4-oxalmesaconate hydratase
MIIDVHGHYTTAPAEQQRFRVDQLAALDDPTLPPPERPKITDDEIRESIELNQLRILRERGGDLMLFSPKASGMEHHVSDQATATEWARASNDLVHRVTELFPDAFAPVAQLPQTPDGELGSVIDELRRCVDELGFVGCNLNPDPTAGYWTTPPMTDEY